MINLHEISAMVWDASAAIAFLDRLIGCAIAANKSNGETNEYDVVVKVVVDERDDAKCSAVT